MDVRRSTTREAFHEMVKRAKEYIEAGDIFQVVLSQQFRIPLQVDPFTIYRHLRLINPSPYLFFLRCEGPVLIGSSPEILCRLEDGRIDVRPIAGTRRRGRTPEEDRALEARAARRSEGARRAPDAGRPRPQRRRARRGDRLGARSASTPASSATRT